MQHVFPLFCNQKCIYDNIIKFNNNLWIKWYLIKKNRMQKRRTSVLLFSYHIFIKKEPKELFNIVDYCSENSHRFKLLNNKRPFRILNEEKLATYLFAQLIAHFTNNLEMILIYYKDDYERVSLIKPFDNKPSYSNYYEFFTEWLL